ncbi:MAG: hypothetical protein JOZ15_09245 [Acidobacteria bacterium]|nr:hypothetical protein [Acidobacteriota bacterium]
MRSKVMRCMTAMILFAALPFPVRLAAQDRHQAGGQAQKYLIVDLGSGFAGQTSKNGSQASSINDFGFEAGSAFIGAGSVQHAALWVYGFAIDLGALGGPTTSSDVVFPGLNDLGEVVGITETATPDPNNEPWSCGAFIARAPGTSCVGFLWRNGVMTALPTLGGANGFAAGINNRGQAVGWAENTIHDPTCDTKGAGQVLQFKAVVWEPSGQVVQLLSFHGEPDSAAVTINDRGQIAGISGTCGQAVGGVSANHAVLWDDGTVTDLGNHLGGKGWNTPLSINNEGVIVGFTNVSNDVGNPTFRGFIWTRGSGKETSLDPLPGDAISEAQSVNDDGQIVGISYAAGFSNPRAVIWIDGRPIDMNSLPLTGAALHLTDAAAINQRGEITGTAVDANGNAVSFLAIPLD